MYFLRLIKTGIFRIFCGVHLKANYRQGRREKGVQGGAAPPSKQSRRQNPNIHRQISANSGRNQRVSAERYSVSS